MPIEINKSTTRVNLPIIRLVGTVIDTQTGTFSTNVTVDYDPSQNPDIVTSFTTSTLIGTAQVTISGLSVTRRDEIVFSESVTLSFITDSKWGRNEYTSSSFTGTNITSKDNINRLSNTYYSLNGKDPKRSKNYLYTGGNILIRRNSTGSDKTTLKVRTYIRGRISPVMIIQFRIVKSNSLRV